MVRACVLLCAVALCAAVAPPTIELELAADLTKHSGVPGIVKGDTRYHRDGKTVGFQDYTQTCMAGKNSGGKIHPCKLPVAKAYDHFDKKVAVTQRFFLVDKDGSTVNKEKSAKFFKNNYWKHRSSWLIKYDAKDASGNKAKQLVYGLIMNDITRPVIKACSVPSKIEGNAGFKLCGDSFVTDNMDTIKGSELKYDVTKNGRYILRNGKLAAAQKAIKDCAPAGTKYVVTLKVTDHAKSYGTNGRSNVAKQVSRTTVVVDTIKPVIALKGISSVVQECSVKYTDAGATASDQLDTCMKKSFSFKHSNTFKKSTKQPINGRYNYCYDTQDVAGNNANKVCRSVKVTDTKRPTVKVTRWNGWRKVVVEHELIGKSTKQSQKSLKSQIKNTRATARGKHMVHMAKDGVSFVDPGFTSTDACDDLQGKKIKHNAWWVGGFNDRKVGTYTRKYKATDSSGNKHSQTRKVVVVDAQAPIITINGGDEKYEATRDRKYTDKGAKCWDYVSGQINDAVKVGGDIVSLTCNKKAGTKCPQVYSITYDCMDAAGLKAQTMVRKVTVVDTTKPKVSILGSKVYNMEAGFYYQDAGATATDSLDGDVTKKIYVDGNTVNTRYAFTQHSSCNDVKAQFKKPQLATDGYYTITTKVGRRKRATTVWCHMGAKPLTLSLAFSWRKIRPYYSARGSVCGARGLDMLKYDRLTKKEKKIFARRFPTIVPRKDRTGRYAYSNYYVCSTNDQHIKFSRRSKDTRSLTQKMRKGKYVISYYVQDKAGNHQRSVAKRTVVVKDTLPPVITLHLKGNLIHQSASNHRAVHDKRIKNPATTGKQHGPKGTFNPFLKAFDPKVAKVTVVNKFPTYTKYMAETVSVNGWMIAAAASAVTGLALVSLSTKKQTIEV